ncbi:MAG: cation:proton antiporter [Magnetospirillum sp.]|nr:cation:proton antiporter [Magnetospirillum sp.]
MTDPSLLTEVVVLLAAAVVAVPLFHALKAGAVMGYLAAGLLVGPQLLGLVAGVEHIRQLAEFGVVFLLFAVGLELKPSRLWVMRHLVFGLGGLQVVATAAALAVILALAGLSPAEATVAGGGLALSSTAVVLQCLTERGEMASRSGRIALAVLLMQDIAVVPLLVLVTVLTDGVASPLAEGGRALARALLVGGGVLIAGRFLVRPFLRLIARVHTPELFAGAAILVVLATAWVTQAAGLSMTLGAFMAGLVLAETEFRHQVEADLQPFRGFLLGLFFMTVGMSLDLDMMAGDLPRLLSLLAVVVVVKAVLLAALAAAFRLGRDSAVQVGLLLAQGGELAFVVFASAGAAGVFAPGTVRVLNLTVTLSMALTPLLAALAAHLAAMLRRHGSEGEGLDALAGLSGHVIVAGYGRVGQTVGRLLSERGIAFVALDLALERVTSGRALGLSVFYADASRRAVLEAAGAARARAVVLTLDRPGAIERAMRTIRSYYPDLPIYARARDHIHGGLLRQAGAAAAVPETVEASLQLGGTVLRALGTPGGEAEALLDALRKDDYAGLRPR